MLVSLRAVTQKARCLSARLCFFLKKQHRSVQQHLGCPLLFFLFFFKRTLAERTQPDFYMNVSRPTEVRCMAASIERQFDQQCPEVTSATVQMTNIVRDRLTRPPLSTPHALQQHNQPHRNIFIIKRWAKRPIVVIKTQRAAVNTSQVMAQ